MASTNSSSPAPATTTPKPSAISALLSGFGDWLADPKNAALIGFARGLGAAGAPHMLTPLHGAQALSAGLEGAQSYPQQSLANQLTRTALLPFQQMRTQEFERAAANPGNPNSASVGLQFAGIDPTKVPATEAAIAHARSTHTPTLVGAGARVFGDVGPPSVGAQGQLPAGATQNPQTGAMQITPSAALALAQSAYNEKGGGAAGALAYQQILKLTGYFKRSPGEAAGFRAPPARAFTPAGSTTAPPAAGTGNLQVPPAGGTAVAGPPARTAPQRGDPVYVARAFAALRARQMAMVEGLRATAQATGTPSPIPAGVSTGAPMGQLAPAGAATTPPGAGARPAAVTAPGVGAAAAADARKELDRSALEERGAGGSPQEIGEKQFPARFGLAMGTLQPGAVAAPQGGGLVSPGMTVAQYAAAKAVGNQTGDSIEGATKVSDTARRQIAIYNLMGQALDKMGPLGQWRDVSTPLGKLANYFGFTPLNITSAAEFTKFRTQLVGQVTREVSPRASTQELDFLAKQVPDYNLPGNSAHVLLSELRGLSQYSIIKSNALPLYLQTIASKGNGLARGTSLGFEKWWNTTGPSPGSIVLGSVVSSLPPAQRSAYVRSLHSTFTGKHMLHQYARARAFEAQYPDLFGGL